MCEIKRLIKSLEGACEMAMILPIKDQVSRVSKILTE